MERVEQIEGLLVKLGIHMGRQKPERLALAAKLASGRHSFDESVALSLLEEAAVRRSARNPAAMILTWLEDGSWVEMVDELRAQGEFSGLLEQRGRREESNIGGKLGQCSADNPYGWSKPESLKGQDHNLPGRWNPYRQSYNLPAGEGRGSDYRRRGCSCLPGVEATAEWDSSPVLRAVDAPVYGE